MTIVDTLYEMTSNSTFTASEIHNLILTCPENMCVIEYDPTEVLDYPLIKDDRTYSGFYLLSIEDAITEILARDINPDSVLYLTRENRQYDEVKTAMTEKWPEVRRDIAFHWGVDGHGIIKNSVG